MSTVVLATNQAENGQASGSYNNYAMHNDGLSLVLLKATHTSCGQLTTHNTPTIQASGN
jgi:hypothetical protein